MSPTLRTVFVIGPPRSGTTLLGFLLGGSPNVLSISEPHLARAAMTDWKFQRFASRFQRENRLNRVQAPLRSEDGAVLRWLQALTTHNGLTTLAVKETFRTGAVQPAFNNPEQLDRLARQFACFFVVRHPYDTAASTIKLCKWAIGWRGRLCRLRWRGMPWFPDRDAVVRWAADNWARYGRWLGAIGRKAVRYEDFVADPPAALRQMCDTLGMPFDPRMLDHRQPRRAFGGIGDFDVLRKAPRPITGAAIGRGSALTPAQREIVRQTCGALAAEYGYELA